MALLHIPIDQISEQHLTGLIAGGSPETRTIEYKRETYGTANSDYSEFLADISSFANTAGGDLLLGVDATNGIPTAISPLTIAMDPEVLRLEQVARGGIQPRIANLGFRVVPVSGGNVLVIRIPRSFSAPHRVIRQGSSRFWARSAAGKYEPDVNELRALFNAGPQLAQRVRDFRLDRAAAIAADRAPVRLMNRGILVMHILPLSAFDAPASSLPLEQIKQAYTTFAPIGSSSANGARINFDGVLKTSNADQQATQHRAYVQLFRNGILEAVDSTICAVSSGSPIISYLDDKLINETVRAMRDLASVGIEPPYAVLISFVGISGAQFNFSRGHNAMWFDNLSDRLDRDQYHFDEVIFETIPTTPTECATILRPVLDQMANAGGRGTSIIFDHTGRYVPIQR